jgi:hypothetical protein
MAMFVYHGYVRLPEGKFSDENLSIPVVPHKAVAEVSKIGNL